MLRRFWPGFLLFAASAVGTAAVLQLPASPARKATLADRERHAFKTRRASEFNNVPHVSARAACEENEPPEALATPDPLVIPAAGGRKIKVSFIIGADGRVHSPLILESAGPVGDRSVLQTVRHWRYRPATCNGVPTEAEGKIEFSQR
jgi:TonB family protein